MYSCDVPLTKDQVDVLKRSCVQSMLDSVRKMDEILVRHLKSSDYDLSKDKTYLKWRIEFETQRSELDYFNEVSKKFDD